MNTSLIKRCNQPHAGLDLQSGAKRQGLQPSLLLKQTWVSLNISFHLMYYCIALQYDMIETGHWEGVHVMTNYTQVCHASLASQKTWPVCKQLFHLVVCIVLLHFPSCSRYSGGDFCCCSWFWALQCYPSLWLMKGLLWLIEGVSVVHEGVSVV